MVGVCWTQTCLLTIGLLLFLFCIALGDLKHAKEKDKEPTSLQLPPCEACELVYESFMDAMKLTAQNHFGGGDTSWEEAKLGPYASSEVRLIEIQELLCKKNRAQDQCLTLVEEWEQHIEDWWFKHRKETPDLYEFLCINQLKVCCPPEHFGPECKPCPGHPNNVCSSNGQCKGSGTRGGTGKCHCKQGYDGELCDKCANNYFELIKDNKLSCEKCDLSCEGGCSSAGPEKCNNCAKGWTLETGKGCLDIDECNISAPSICKENTFCMNIPGSFKCLKCDSACEGCTGPGPEHCIKCSSDHTLDGSICVKYDSLKSHLNITHYLLYLGLIVATFILFKNYPLLTSVVGVGIAVYVTMTDYMLDNILRSELFTSFSKIIKIW